MTQCNTCDICCSEWDQKEELRVIKLCFYPIFPPCSSGLFTRVDLIELLDSEDVEVESVWPEMSKPRTQSYLIPTLDIHRARIDPIETLFK